MGCRVLVIDDDRDLLEALARLLGRSGYTCLTTASGAEGIGMIESESFDLVVTDLHMPGIDGIAVMRSARTHEPPIPVVLMTAYPPSWTEGQARQAGATIRVAKPFANADLLNAIRQTLERPQVPSTGPPSVASSADLSNRLAPKLCGRVYAHELESQALQTGCTSRSTSWSPPEAWAKVGAASLLASANILRHVLISERLCLAFGMRSHGGQTNRVEAGGMPCST
jgi:CheY-like chemotaxis protein